jgi:hypothetical protein
MAIFNGDADIIAGQIATFDPAVQAQLIDDLVATRGADLDPRPGVPERQLVKAIVQEGPALLVAPDRIIVRGEHAPATREHLPADWTGPAPVSCRRGLDLDVVVFTAPKGEQVDVALLDQLWERGIAANFTHITPSGPYVKGGGNTPEHPKGTPPSWRRRSRAQAGMGVRIAVIDTGINTSGTSWGRSWLRGIARSAANTDPLNKLSGNVLDEGAGHGTFVAGVIRQVAPDATVTVYLALDSEAIGTEESVACAILEAAADGADIINLSLGSETYKNRPPVALEAALEALPDHVVVVAAAGNQGTSREYWPAAFKRVIGVGALDRTGSGAAWSNRGNWVNFSVLGEGVVSTFVRGLESQARDSQPEEFKSTQPWAMWSGTSFAAPQITGLIATLAHGRTPREAVTELARLGRRVPDFGVAVDSPLLYQGS